MNDEDTKLPSTHRFIKGVKRASFTQDVPVASDSPAPSPQPEPSPVQPASLPPVAVPPPAPVTSVQPVQSVPVVSAVPKKNRVVSNMLWLIVLLMVGGLSYFSYQMYLQYKETTEKLAVVAPNVLLEQDAKSIIEKVRRHMLLPADEPTVNTITEAEKFKNEPFYMNAQNGDIVLVFPRRAILYRPTTDQIIEVGFIRQADQAATFENTPEDALEATSSGEAEVAGAASSSGKVLIQEEE